MLHQALTYLCNMDDAEDVVQEALAKLWQMHDRINNMEMMNHLASVIVKNTSLNTIRNRKATVPIEDILQQETHGTPSQHLEEQETRQRLEKIVSQLPDKQRAVVRMRNVEQLSYTDIAQQ